MTEADSVHSTPPLNTPIDTTTRRQLLTITAAGAVAAAIPAAALTAMSTADPAFDLIEAHRVAHAAHLAAIDEAARLEELDGVDYGDITEKPCDDENDAFEILLGAAATTLPGLIAKLAYLHAIAEGKEAWMLDEREGAALLLIDSFTASLKNVGVFS